MMYVIIGLCLITAVITSWRLSAEPLPFERARPEETPVLVSASDIIHAQRAAQDDHIRTSARADAPAPFAGDARV